MSIKITKYFDSILCEAGGSIFHPMVKTSTDRVLREIISFAKGEIKAKTGDTTISKFETFLLETETVISEGIIKNLQNIKTTSSDKESGIRIACFFEDRFGDFNKPYGTRIIVSYLFTLKNWLKNPVKNDDIFLVLNMMLSFNDHLGDGFAWSLIRQYSDIAN